MEGNGYVSFTKWTFSKKWWDIFTLAKMKHKRNNLQVRAHANACVIFFFNVGGFYSHPETTISMQVFFSTTELEIIIGSAPLLCNHDH